MRHLHPQRCSSERTWDAGVIVSVIQCLRSPVVHKNIQQLRPVSLLWKVQYNGTWRQIFRFIIEVGYGRCLLKISVAWNSILQVFNCQQTVKQPNCILCAMLAFVLQVYNCQKNILFAKNWTFIIICAHLFWCRHVSMTLPSSQVTFVYIALYTI